VSARGPQLLTRFEAWDADFMAAPRDLLSGALDDMGGTASGQLAASPAAACVGLVGNSGAAAVTVLVDSAADKVVVANLGDCRAVAGWYNPSTKKWRCDTLTQDLTCRNPDEQLRCVATQ
jgi:pyruvate dehydrogenase phosphatase